MGACIIAFFFFFFFLFSFLFLSPFVVVDVYMSSCLYLRCEFFFCTHLRSFTFVCIFFVCFYLVSNFKQRMLFVLATLFALISGGGISQSGAGCGTWYIDTVNCTSISASEYWDFAFSMVFPGTLGTGVNVTTSVQIAATTGVLNYCRRVFVFFLMCVWQGTRTDGDCISQLPRRRFVHRQSR
jgi:hypothetical protein